MLIYILLVVLILSMNILLNMNRITKKQFCLIVGAAFILITGLRSVNVGSDTTIYYLDFMAMKHISWESFMSLEKRDIAYYGLAWLLSKTTGSFVILTLLTAFAFYAPIMKLVYKYSDDPGLSCFILMAFNFFQFSMTGMRQTIAFGFAILFFLELHEKQVSKKRAAVFLILGILFHRSALMMVLYPIIKYVSKKRINVQLLLVLIPTVFLFRTTIIDSLDVFFDLVGFDLSKMEEVGGGLTTFLVYGILTVGSLLIHVESSEDEFASNELVLYSIVGTSLQAFVLVNSVFFRVAWYFAIFFIILIPKFLKKGIFIREDLKIFNMLAYAAVLFMYFGITKGSANVLPYEFFWQG